VEGTWKNMREKDLVVQQDKGNVVPHRARRLFLYRLGPFSHHARTIPADHTVWSVPPRMVRADFARRGVSQSRRARFATPLRAAGAVAIGAGFLILSAHLFRLRIILTDSSAPAGIYRIAHSPAGRGALVAACLPPVIARQGLARAYLRTGDCLAGAEPVAKVIGAHAGDIVDVEPGWVAINGVKFSNSQTATFDSSGRPLTHVAWGEHRVSQHEVWLFGFNNARSWDARYFGPVPAANLRGVLKPVVTW
jgi:conjugative transfer signal peptidase TraF